MIRDDRTIRLKQVWAVGDATAPDLTVDPVLYAATPSGLKLGQHSYIVHGRGMQADEVEAIVIGDETLGYAAKNGVLPCGSVFATPKPPKREFGLAIPRYMNVSSKHSPTETVTVVGATTTHTLVFNKNAGGSLSSWTVNNAGAGFADQILNRYDSFVRTLQATAEWVDADSGELTKHQPMQGGDYYSLPTLGDVATSPGSILKSFQVHPLDATGDRRIEVVSIPLDFDPDGAFGAPGLSTGHDGAKYNPVLWKNVRIGLTLTINYKGIENVHKVEAKVYLPSAIKTGFFDCGLYAPLYLDAGKFAQVRCYDAITAVETTLSNGTLGAGDYYEAEYRPYFMNGSVIYEDNVGNVAGGTKITSGLGGVAATGAADANLAVAMVSLLGGDAVTSLDSSVANIRTGNGWVWAQNRAGANGQDGANCVYLAAPSLLTGRWHSHAQVRRIPAGWTTATCFMITDSWTNVKAKMTQLRTPGVL